MINFFRKHSENIAFILCIIFFILGIGNIIFMYISIAFLAIYFMRIEGSEGLVYISVLMGLGIFVAFIFDYFGDIGKYSVIVIGVFYIVFVLYKRYKSGQNLWYW